MNWLVKFMRKMSSVVIAISMLLLIGCGAQPIEEEEQDKSDAVSEEINIPNTVDEQLFYEYSDEEKGYEITLYCTENMDSGNGILTVNNAAGTENSYSFTFDRIEKYFVEDVGPFNVFSEFYLDGEETTILDEETIVEYFTKIEKEYDETFTEFVYEDEKLVYMTEERNHGCVWRFYIYKQDWEGNEGGEPRYMLEIDPGWGVMFYSFE